MDNKKATSNLENMMKFAKNFIKQVETAEGFNLTEEQKVEYNKQIKEKGLDGKLAEAKKEMDKLKQEVKKMNHGAIN